MGVEKNALHVARSFVQAKSMSRKVPDYTLPAACDPKSLPAGRTSLSGWAPPTVTVAWLAHWHPFDVAVPKL
jgi:hypothetical protein